MAGFRGTKKTPLIDGMPLARDRRPREVCLFYAVFRTHRGGAGLMIVNRAKTGALLASFAVFPIAWALFARAEPLPPVMQAALDAHNSYRAKHCVPALAWSTQLAASAQQWANRCDFNHDENSSHGENLFWGTADAYPPKAVVADWYEEIEAYSFAAPRVNDDTGHFTQVIWRRSKHLGCATARCGENEFWVCRYSPPGNDERALSSNVPRPCR